MTQRYVAPIQIVSVKPEYARYSVQEERRKPIIVPPTGRRPDPRAEKAPDGPSSRHFKSIALLILLAALAVVVVLSVAV